MKKASKIIAIFIFAMSVFLGVGAVEVFADTASQVNFQTAKAENRKNVKSL